MYLCPVQKYKKLKQKTDSILFNSISKNPPLNSDFLYFFPLPSLLFKLIVLICMF